MSTAEDWVPQMQEALENRQITEVECVKKDKDSVKRYIGLTSSSLDHPLWWRG
jgi:hypothetical protein